MLNRLTCWLLGHMPPAVELVLDGETNPALGVNWFVDRNCSRCHRPHSEETKREAVLDAKIVYVFTGARRSR